MLVLRCTARCPHYDAGESCALAAISSSNVRPGRTRSARAAGKRPDNVGAFRGVGTCLVYRARVARMRLAGRNTRGGLRLGTAHNSDTSRNIIERHGNYQAGSFRKGGRKPQEL